MMTTTGTATRLCLHSHGPPYGQSVATAPAFLIAMNSSVVQCSAGDQTSFASCDDGGKSMEAQ